MNSDLFFSFITSLLICMALIPPLRLLADRFHFMDQPGERKVHQHPIPRIGGIAFGIGALAQHSVVGAQKQHHVVGALWRIDYPGIRRVGRSCESRLPDQAAGAVGRGACGHHHWRDPIRKSPVLARCVNCRCGSESLSRCSSSSPSRMR